VISFTGIEHESQWASQESIDINEFRDIIELGSGASKNTMRLYSVFET
jgi:hypothetical protein